MRNDVPNDSASNFGARVRETLMTYLGKQGDPLDRGVTLRDLVDSGFASLSNLRFGGGSAPLVAGSAITDVYAKDLTPPPIPTGLTATGAITNIVIECDDPKYTQGHGHLQSRVYGATREAGADNPVFADAVEITQFSGAVTSYSTNPATEWHLWLKWETVDGVLSVSSAGGTNGVVVTTGQDVSRLLTALTGQLKTEQLYSDLSSRISLIDAPATVTNSVAWRVSQEATTRANAVTNEASARAQAILDEAAARATAVSSLQTQMNTLSAASSGDLGSVLTAIQEEQTARTNAVFAEATARSTLATQLRGSYTGTDSSALSTGIIYSERQSRITAEGVISTAVSNLTSSVNNNYSNTNAAIATEATTRATADTALSTSITTLTSTVTGNKTATDAAIATEATTRATADTALSTSITTLTSTVTGNKTSTDAAIATEATTRATADTALSTSITTLTSTVNSNNTTLTSAVSTEATTRATIDGGLLAQYTVKTDLNGYVSGFGLASTVKDATPSSTFAVRADAFYIASPVDNPVTVIPTAATTPAWSSTTTYTTNDLVSYAGNVYYSRGSSNRNHLPYLNIYWTKIRQPIKTLPTAAAWSSTSSYDINAVVSYGGFVWEAQLPLSASTVPPSTSTTNWYKLTVTPDKFLPFIVRTTPTTIDGVVVRPGVYIADGYIQNGTITNAKIGEAEIDNAKISDLSADKITAGTIQVGNYIQSSNYIPGSSGWYIDGEGSAEFGAASIRGTLLANQIGAGTIDATKLSSITVEASKNIKVGNAAVSGNTITGSGAVFNGDGTLALGNSTANISYNGTTMTLNGNIVGTGNIYLNSVTTTNSVELFSDFTTSSSSYVSVVDSPIIVTTGGQPMAVYFSIGAYHRTTSSTALAEIRISIHDGTSYYSGYGNEIEARLLYLEQNKFSSEFGMIYFATTPVVDFKVAIRVKLSGTQNSGDFVTFYSFPTNGANPAVPTYMNILVTKR